MVEIAQTMPAAGCADFPERSNWWRRLVDATEREISITG